jgi:DUF971 family protein
LKIYPKKLELTDEGCLQIAWSDDETRQYSVRELRDICPCATCREKRGKPQSLSLLPVLSPEEIEPLKITGMKPVGNYAYSIQFTDGHDTGIYTLDLLRSLGRIVTAD